MDESGPATGGFRVHSTPGWLFLGRLLGSRGTIRQTRSALRSLAHLLAQWLVEAAVEYSRFPDIEVRETNGEADRVFKTHALGGLGFFGEHADGGVWRETRVLPRAYGVYEGGAAPTIGAADKFLPGPRRGQVFLPRPGSTSFRAAIASWRSVLVMPRRR